MSFRKFSKAKGELEQDFHIKNQWKRIFPATVRM